MFVTLWFFFTTESFLQVTELITLSSPISFNQDPAGKKKEIKMLALWAMCNIGYGLQDPRQIQPTTLFCSFHFLRCIVGGGLPEETQIINSSYKWVAGCCFVDSVLSFSATWCKPLLIPFYPFPVWILIYFFIFCIAHSCIYFSGALFSSPVAS